VTTLVKHKILILSDSLPGTQGGHGIILLKQIINYGIDKFCLFSGARTPKYKPPSILKKVATQVSPIEYFRGRKINRYIKKIPLIEEIIFFISLQFRKYELVNFVKKNNVILIYAVLRGDSVALIKFLLKKTNLPLISYIPDTIEAEKINDKRFIYHIKKIKYYQAIHQSKFLAGPGISMAKYLKKEYNKDSVIFSSILENNLIPTIKKDSISLNQITFGFAGSLYAKEEFAQFTLALSKFALKYKTHNISLLVISDKKPLEIDNVNIEFFNWTTPKKVLQILSKADIGYLPYRFDEKYEKQMRFAFPSKIISYLALQIPVFFHGPDYSSVNTFFTEYTCGVSCNSLFSDEIIKNLERLVFNSDFYEDCKQICSKAFREEFSEEKLNQNFSYFIDQGLNYNMIVRNQ
jgi:glycosyltransferase involved in cell wall biosynthesis